MWPGYLRRRAAPKPPSRSGPSTSTRNVRTDKDTVQKTEREEAMVEEDAAAMNGHLGAGMDSSIISSEQADDALMGSKSEESLKLISKPIVGFYDWRFVALLPFARFFVLLLRTFKCIIRDKNLTLLRLISHVTIGCLIGGLYFDIGNDTYQIPSNKACIFLSMLFLMFTALMPTVMTFPSEMEVFLREHLNCWYNVTMYYFAKTLADIPFQTILPLIYSTIIYFMTSQPIECLAISGMVSLNAQSLGLLIGAATSLQVAVFVGPITAIPILLFSGFFIPYSAITIYLRWLCYGSYIRYAYECALLAIYGFGRDEYSFNRRHWKDAISNLQEDDWWIHLAILGGFFAVLRMLTFMILYTRARYESRT